MIAVQVSRPCAFWAAGLLLALLAGSFLLGASASAAYLLDVRADCADRRAEALDAALQTKKAIGEFLCAKRGICFTDEEK